MDEDEKIRRKAHQLWEAEGRPEGRHESHWTEAREIVALEEGAGQAALKPVEETVSEPIEPAIAATSHGEVPGLTDLGEEGGAPSRAKAADIAKETPPGQEGPGGAPRRRR